MKDEGKAFNRLFSNFILPPSSFIPPLSGGVAKW